MSARTLLVAFVIACTGCATYVTPGGPARLEEINRADIAAVASRKPTLRFPAHVAVLRIQGRDYRSFSTEGYGAGRYTAVTTQELLTDEQLAAVSSWPSIAGATPVSRLTLPQKLDSVDDLRLAAAQIQADVLLVYTIETSFRVQGRGYGPLAVISLGTVPDRDAYITATASALFIDVRSGFVYGVAESTAKKSGLTNVWNSGSTIDRKRLEAEKEATAGLMEQAARTWTGITAQYSPHS